MTYRQDPRIAEHLDRVAALTDDERVRVEAAIVAPYVDAPFYASAHGRSVPGAGSTAAEHFCRTGWRELLKPAPSFDVWWYWANYLDPGVADLNPLVHYALVGERAGLLPRPHTLQSPTTATLPAPPEIRRACLFAAFDQDGIVDEATVRLIGELSRHSDVFVLYDNYVAPEELRKLDGIAEGAWAIRHGAYDFGSYSLLARDLVGWSRLEAYDEVLFVNDSCFLVRELDDVFATMAGRDCSWWGLQATKGLASTRHQASTAFTEPMTFEEVRRRLPAWEDDAVYDFHLGSYFLAFRRPVIADERFRALVDAVAPTPSKLQIILRYEIGLTHLLLGRGHGFDAYVTTLHPFHPLFTATQFALLRDGFPLLKRYFIYQNHYDVPGMRRWKEQVLEAAPEAPVDLFERLLVRTAPDDRLRRSYAIRRSPDGEVKVPRVVYGNAYRRRDENTEKHDDLWVFAVDPVTHTLPASSRAILEAVKDDSGIRKLILTRSKPIQYDGREVAVEPLLSPPGRRGLLEAGRVFVPGEPWAALSAPVTPERQLIVAVRHGLHFEKPHAAPGPAIPPRPDAKPSELAHPEPDLRLSGLLAASDVDALAAVTCTFPVRYTEAWRTGIPAHDFLFCDEEALPADLLADVRRLRSAVGGRRLVVLRPSLRRTGSPAAPYTFDEAEKKWLRAWCEQNDVVLGIREQETDLERAYSVQLKDQAIDLSAQRFGSLPAIYRVASAVVTDYASDVLDFAVTGRPVAAFVHDLSEARERLLYDPQHFFPGPVASDFAELSAAMDQLLTGATSPYDRVRRMLIDQPDDQSTRRALARIDQSAEAGQL